MKRLGKGCLIIVGVFVLLVIVVTLFGGGKGNQQSSGSGSSGNSAPTAVAPVHRVGQDLQVGEVRWKVLEASDLGQTLKSDNQFVKDMTSTGHFVRVRLEVENLSKDMVSFTGIDLQDDQGRTFKRSSDAIMRSPSGEECVLENLNPNVAKTCTLIYEVPQNAAHVQVMASDLKLFGGQSTLIDLGL